MTGKYRLRITLKTEFPNKWLDEEDLPGFRRSIQSYYNAFQAISQDIMRVLELGLELSNRQIVNRSTFDNSELRLNYYPEVMVKELSAGNARRASPHIDSGIIPLLLQDQVGGLEVEDRRRPGTFLPVVSGNSVDLVFNVSDT